MSTKTDICGQLYGGTPEHLKYPPQGTTLGQATPTTYPIWYPSKTVEELRARAEKAEAEVERLTELLRLAGGFGIIHLPARSSYHILACTQVAPPLTPQ
jgi:hypothetical protein